ncbi:hypothetical protein L6452_19090 [Arctium lappa]|uniref:Uncharacterized protein n=1 Tax=Arctium lappa TaxID=4217 RepID=A0ACB9B805_ARCLA|nr:hypothetical protein L6452_19090 [Arctium lappa]
MLLQEGYDLCCDDHGLIQRSLWCLNTNGFLKNGKILESWLTRTANKKMQKAIGILMLIYKPWPELIALDRKIRLEEDLVFLGV